ncbi:MAG: YeeE/YedE thiosulfate transporter family protein [Polyangia bacterium]
MRAARNPGLTSALLGLPLGWVLSRSGFSAWDEVHRMFVLADARLFLAFALAALVLVPAWRILERTRRAPLGTPRPLHPGTVPGGLLFGAGWALCGACPAVAFIQLGEGQLLGLCTVAGLFTGNLLFGVLQGRVFRFSTGPSCSPAELP